MKRLRSGIFLAPFHAIIEDVTTTLDRDMELVELLDHLGYDEAWIGEHHSAGFEIIASPEIFIGAAAERTKYIKLGTGVVSLPYHSPMMVADRMTLLDHMTRGRAMLGVGPGALVSDAMMFGVKTVDQRRRVQESVDVIMRLLRGETVTRETDWFTLRNARLQLPPYSEPHIEVVISSSRTPVSGLLAGQWGLGMVSISGTSDLGPAGLVRQLDHRREKCAAPRAEGRAQQAAHLLPDACGGDARKGARERQIWIGAVVPLSGRGWHLCDRPSQYSRSRQLSD